MKPLFEGALNQACRLAPNCLRAFAYWLPAFLAAFTPSVAQPLAQNAWPTPQACSLGLLGGLAAGALAVKALFDPTATDAAKTGKETAVVPPKPLDH